MVGKTVVRRFEGKNYVGKIVSYDAAAKYYRIHYPADDDCEELSYHQLHAWEKLIVWESCGWMRNTKR